MITNPVIEIHLTSKRISELTICFHSTFGPLNRQAHFLEQADDLVDHLLNRKT